MRTSRRRFVLQSLAGLGCLAGADKLAARNLDSSIIGMNTYFPGWGLYRSIEALQKLGFQTVEMQPMGTIEPRPGVPPGFQFDRLSAEEKQRLKKAVEGFRYVSTHVPWTDLHYFSPFDNIAKFSARQIDIALEATAFLGAEVANIHAQRSAHLSLEQSWPLMVRQFRRWGDFAKAAGFRLSIETGYPQSVRDFVRFIEEIDHSHVGATIDVGHQKEYTELLARVKPGEKGTPAGIKAYNDINHELIDRLGAKLFHFHVHDIEPDTWAEHKPLIHGFIDYPRLIKKLRKTNYQGLLIFEIGGAAEDLPAILRDSKRKLERHLAKN